MVDPVESANQQAGEARPYPLHAIQLTEMRVVEISLKTNLNVERSAAVGTFDFGAGHSPYDAENKRIQVKVSARMGHDEDAAPFSLFVELIGLFTVDESRFPVKHIAQWAKSNAPLVLYPYIREHAYALAVRAGFPAVIFPLLEVPTFRIMPGPDGEARIVTTRAEPKDS